MSKCLPGNLGSLSSLYRVEGEGVELLASGGLGRLCEDALVTGLPQGATHVEGVSGHHIHGRRGNNVVGRTDYVD